ncbi:hypothetical protein JZU54_04540, partial [bacterium]|nr:hypothetical protein [bacterium]
TNSYWMRGYGYQDGDLQPDAPTPLAAGTNFGNRIDQVIARRNSDTAAPASFAEVIPSDTLSPDVATLMQVTAPAWGSMADQLQQLADAASSPQQLQQAMVQAFGDLDSAELVKLMAAAMALAELKGMDSARGEL